MIQKSINLLGQTMRDKVTGITGMVSSVCFDAYGCIQIILSQKANKDGSLQEGRWFDVSRLEVTGKRLLATPAFPDLSHGPADKPLP